MTPAWHRLCCIHFTDKLLELPIEILAEIVRYAEGIDWDGGMHVSAGVA